VRTSTKPPIVPCDVRIRENLGQHKTISRRAERRVAAARELELLTKEQGECRALLGCSERDAKAARIADKGRVVKKPSNLSYGLLEDKRVRDA
jgi:hypothetical protein